jgi:hypothetical protein
MEWYGLDLSLLRQEPVEDSCEHGNEISSSINFRNFLVASQLRLVKIAQLQQVSYLVS